MEVDRFSTFLSVLLGIIVGVVVFTISKHTEITALLSLLVGITTTMVANNLTEFARQSRKISELNDTLSNLFFNIGKIQHTSWELSQIMSYGITTIKMGHIPNVWMELLWKMEYKYFGISYSNPDLWWNTEFSKLALEIQRVKINVSKADIRRIFIFKDYDEKNKFNITMQDQVSIGIKVKYIFENDIYSNASLNNLYSDLETLDYALIDSKISWLVILKNRKFYEGKILIDETIFRKYDIFYNRLFEEAKVFNAIE